MGDNASSLSVGEVWHFFEQQLKTDIHLIWEVDSNKLKTTGTSYSVCSIKYTRRVIEYPLKHAIQDIETTQFLVHEYVD
jgi:hypothetical protein